MAEPSDSELRCGIDFRMNFDNDDIIISSKDDFSTIKYYDNLKQAIINRLRTPKGSLTEHPYYGSQLHELIGTKVSSLTLVEAEQYSREALLQEPRIKRINSIKTNFQSGTNMQAILIEISVTPLGQDSEPLNMVWPYIITG